MNRRGFIGTVLTLAAAPAIVRASSLMPVHYRPTGFLGGDFCIEYWVHPTTRWLNDIRLTRRFSGTYVNGIERGVWPSKDIFGNDGWIHVVTDKAGLSLLPENLRLELSNIM